MSIAPGSDPLGVLEFIDGGNYLVMAKVQLDAPGDMSGNQATVECTLEAGDTIDRSAVSLSALGVATLPLSAPATLSGPGTAVLRCEVSGFSIMASRVKLTANKVDSLDFQP